jgi:hypothetical protein
MTESMPRSSIGGRLARDHLVLFDDDLVGLGVDDRVDAHAADDLVAERHVDLLALVDGALEDAALAAAVVLADDDDCAMSHSLRVR